MDPHFYWTVSFASTLLMTGCIDDSASYEIGGRDRTLSVIRIQPHFWEESVELSLVVSWLPECQRRHALENMDSHEGKIELYETEAQNILLRENKNWYKVESESCSVAAIEPPMQGVQGALQGTFEEDKSEKLVFVEADLTKRK